MTTFQKDRCNLIKLVKNLLWRKRCRSRMLSCIVKNMFAKKVWNNWSNKIRVSSTTWTVWWHSKARAALTLDLDMPASMSRVVRWRDKWMYWVLKAMVLRLNKSSLRVSLSYSTLNRSDHRKWDWCHPLLLQRHRLILRQGNQMNDSL